MIYSIAGIILAGVFPTKTDRSEFRKFCRKIDYRRLTDVIQKRYVNILKKLRKKNKLKVVFLVNENSKWKTQSLYNLMEQEKDFEPVIALTIADIQKNLDLDEKKKILESNFNFFKNKQIKTVIAYDIKKNTAVDLKLFNPDIVFYQQPYDIPKNQDIKKVSRYALTCYVPYYLPGYKNFDVDCDRNFHHNLFRYYVLNEEIKNVYTKHLNEKLFYSKNIISTGHTMLDRLQEQIINNKISNDKYVIYAPHWSICHEKNKNSINISTFNLNGKAVLKYALEHPQIKWIFKPHPTLKTTLLKIGEMTEKEIDDYYKSWECIADCCYDFEYIELFNKSSAMLTDCGSFIPEYFCTKKPIIHLISPYSVNPPYVQTKEIFDTLYKANNTDEIYYFLDEVIIKNKDTLKDKRLKVLEKFNFGQNNAALNILTDLKKTIQYGQNLQ